MTPVLAPLQQPFYTRSDLIVTHTLNFIVPAPNHKRLSRKSYWLINVGYAKVELDETLYNKILVTV